MTDQNDSTKENPPEGGNSEDGAGSHPSGLSGIQRWQQRLLPFMIWMVVGLTLFFFIASFAQLAYLHVNIQDRPEVEVESIAPPRNASSTDKARKLNILAQLEASALEHRYHQANVFLMSRVWARYLGFVTGMILALVGAAFILGKLRDKKATEISAEGMGGVMNLRSTSPGIILAVFGVTLMITTIVTHHDITTADSSVYIHIPFAEKPYSESSTTSPDSTALQIKEEDLPSNFP